MSRKTRDYNASLTDEQNAARRDEWNKRNAIRCAHPRLVHLSAPIVELQTRGLDGAVLPEANIRAAVTKEGSRTGRNHRLIADVSDFRGTTYKKGN